MASQKTSKNLKFQYYVDMAKQKVIPWHVFENLMEDLSHSDLNRLKYLNAILLTELTVSYSDMDRMKYLNMILMTKFKDSIQKEDDIAMPENENLQVYHNSFGHDLNNEISSENEIQEDTDLPIYNKSKSFHQEENLKELVYEVDHDFNDETIKEVSSDSEIQFESEKENQEEVHSPIIVVDHDLNDETTNKEIPSDIEIHIPNVSENERQEY